MISLRYAAVTAAILVATLLSGTAWAEATKVTFILTNDIYQMGDTPMSDGQRRGGFARLAAVVKAERAKGGHVIFAHGGDTLSPSLMSGIDRGAHIIELTNMIPPDIFVPGNHEFDFGKAVFLQRMAEAKFGRFAANVRQADGSTLPGFHNRTLLTFDGVRIGLTGAAYDDSRRTSTPEDLVFTPTVPTIREQAEALRRDGADFVVAVMHATRAQAHELAATRAVDLVLTGHSHDLLVNFNPPVAIVESSYDAHNVVLIDVTIEVAERDGRRTVSWWPQFRIVDTATVTPDPEVAAVVAKYQDDLNRDLDVVLGTTEVELDSRVATVRMREAAIGNLIADAMREATGAEVAVMNGGGIRGGKIYRAGAALTRRDVLGELPFGNRLVVIELRGRDLRRALEAGLSRMPAASGGFPQVSGLTVEVDPKRPAGDRIVSMSVGGAPLVPDRPYRVATNDFLARGGDGYAPFGAATPALPLSDSPLLVNAVMNHLRKLGTANVGVSGRIVVK